jgi:hypothetical protein
VKERPKAVDQKERPGARGVGQDLSGVKQLGELLGGDPIVLSAQVAEV